MKCSLELDNVWKRYSLNQGWVLRGVSLCLKRGEGYTVIGPNGSGKTTLLRIAAGLVKPSKGAVRVRGEPPSSTRAKKLYGTVLHHSLLYDELTVRENLEYYASLYGLRDYRPEEDEAVVELGLKRYLDTRVGELSFGWKKRANIARALIHRPQLLIIDEPFTGLDDEAIMKLSKLLASLVENGVTVLATSPQKLMIPFLQQHTLYRLSGGRLVEEASKPQ